MVDGYKAMLGAPAVEEPEELVWHDAATGFELRLDTASVPAVLRSRLLDLQLGG